jgi:hypothetical protein
MGGREKYREDDWTDRLEVNEGTGVEYRRNRDNELGGQTTKE